MRSRFLLSAVLACLVSNVAWAQLLDAAPEETPGIETKAKSGVTSQGANAQGGAELSAPSGALIVNEPAAGGKDQIKVQGKVQSKRTQSEAKKSGQKKPSDR